MITVSVEPFCYVTKKDSEKVCAAATSGFPFTQQFESRCWMLISAHTAHSSAHTYTSPHPAHEL